ncbi:MAG: HNH endonuclease [Cyclobacteriaceae bacterium]
MKKVTAKYLKKFKKLRVDRSHETAPHIITSSESLDDTVSNGIALCPNLHRAFDRGLITITPDFEVLISDEFIEEGFYSIHQFAGCKVNLPQDKKCWPSRENLEWHKVNVFRH